MDLGGASTQIVFQPSSPIPPSSHRIDMTFSGKTYTLYQHSYLGYGLMQGRTKIKSFSINSGKSGCIASGRVETFSPDAKSASMQITGTRGGYSDCAVITQKVFKSDTCAMTPCSFDGVYMPSLATSFSYEQGYEIYAFSYFYDRTEPLGLTSPLTPSSLLESAKRMCSSSLSPGELALSKENPDFCMDLSYIHALLSVGYGMEESRPIHVTKKVNGFETGWCLGATIHMLDQMFVSGDLSSCSS